MERRTLKTKSGDVLLEFIDGYWIVYPIQPTYWRKDPQALRMMAQESNTEPSEIDQSKLKFESFHIIDLSKRFVMGTFDLGRSRGCEEGEIANHVPQYGPFEQQFGPLGFLEADLYPFTDRMWTWLQEMRNEGVVKNPKSENWPTDRRYWGSKVWKAYYEDLEEEFNEEEFDEDDLDEEEFDEDDLDEEEFDDFDEDDFNEEEPGEKSRDLEDEGRVPRAQGIAHSAVIKEPRRLFDLLFRWSDSGNRLVFSGNDEADTIKRFVTEVFESVGGSESLISSLDTLCSPRPIRILLPGLVEWTDMLIPWMTRLHDEDLGVECEDADDWELLEDSRGQVPIVPNPISLSEILLEWNPKSGFRLISRKSRSKWGWVEHYDEDSDEYNQQLRPFTVEVSVIESVVSDQIESGDELFKQILRLVEDLCDEWRFEKRFTDSEYIYQVGCAGSAVDDEWDSEGTEEDEEQGEERFNPSKFDWSSVAAFLASFPEIHDDFQRALGDSGLLDAVTEISETTSTPVIVDQVDDSLQESTEGLIHTGNASSSDVEMHQTESLPRLFRICLECGYWSYTDEKCYLDESELIPISDPQGEARSPGTEMTSPSGIEFVWIPPGSFMMGSPSTEWGRSKSDSEGPQRLVTIGQGFWMGRFEVTQGQYEAVMGMNPSSCQDCGKDHPVEWVSWKDAKEFIKRLNNKNEGFIYSLPTEAEWEYAARAGTTTAFAFGDSLSPSDANFGRPIQPGKSYEPNGTKSVGSYKANAWGLYDMHGNVWEWVEDIQSFTLRGLPIDGSANTTKGERVCREKRGGSFLNYANCARSASRNSNHHTHTSRDCGFRIVARAKNESGG